jgi:riboflavin synthase
MEVEIDLSRYQARFVAEKGSIAVDGVSLTVAGITEQGFSVARIRHTLEKTVARLDDRAAL